MTKLTISDQYQDLISGNKNVLFTSMEAALKKSRKVTTNPNVITIQVPNTPGSKTTYPYYLAGGDYWIGRDNSRGQYIYGRQGQLIEVSYV